MAGKPADAKEYIAARVTIEDCGFTSPCWIWKRCVGRNGYGQGTIPGTARTSLAHRISYGAFVGPVPDGLSIDHLCRTKACVNPNHLEAVTQAENVRRGRAAEAARAMQLGLTHCRNGHEFTEENTGRNNRGSRYCRTCNRKSALALYHRKKEDA